MPTHGFHSEWGTVRGCKNEHRVLLESRAGFPSEEEKFIARVAAEVLDRNSDGGARVVSIFYDDKSCMHNVAIASTKKQDAHLESLLLQVLHLILGHGNPQVQFVHVETGDVGSDHYNHMEHLSIGAKVAVDRWRHKDKKYQATVINPS